MSFESSYLSRSSLVGVVALVGLGLFDWLMPRPQLQGAVAKQRADIPVLEREVRELRERVGSLRTEQNELLWEVGDGEIGPAALAKVSGVAKKAGIRLTSFRPQRVQEEGELVRLSYMVAVDGGFPALARFVRELENSGAKLAVSSVQISAADGATDRVTASVGLIAYRRVELGGRERG